jgi:hypothetical protein
MATGLPTATSWYMNPYFMASFGAVVALGFVLFALAYFVFVKLKVGQTPQPTMTSPIDKCATCGLTGEMVARLIPCKDHAGIVSRIDGITAWIKSHEEDYRQLRKRLDDFIDQQQKRGPR